MATRRKKERDFHDRVFQDRTRQRVTEYYAVVRASRKRYEAYLREHAPGKQVLEYGCGPGSYAFALAAWGARVVGIDISPVAIEQAQLTAWAGDLLDIEFRVMDAESLEFAEGSFDLVCGTGILHHLDLDRAFPEIRRVLRPGGSAIFIEPLGHNPLINRFRKATPDLRTGDEHPLLTADLERAREFFDLIEMRPYGLLTLAAIPFRNVPGFTGLLAVLETLDAMLFRLCPWARKHAWQAVLVLSRPTPPAHEPGSPIKASRSEHPS